MKEKIRRSWLLSWCGVGWLIGLFWQLQQASLAPAWARYAALTASVVVLGLMHWTRPCSWLLRPLCLLSLALLSWASTEIRASERLAQRWPASLDGTVLQVNMTLSELPVRREFGMRFRGLIELTEPTEQSGEQAAGVGVRGLPAPRIWHGQLQVPDRPWPDAPQAVLEHVQRLQAMEPGETWRLWVRLRSPRGFMNPHAFDAEWFYWRDEVDLLASPDWRHLGAERAPALEQQPLLQIRQSVKKAMRAALSESPPRVSDLLVALTVGDQAAIQPDDWFLYRETGIAHLVSISGLHITGLAWLSVVLIRQIWRLLCRCGVDLNSWPVEGWCWSFGWSVACVYAIFAGWGIPAQRTVIMLGAWCVLRTVGVRWPWQIQCGLAAWLVLIWDPWGLLQAGFWLSFVGVAALMLFSSENMPRHASSNPGDALHTHRNDLSATESSASPKSDSSESRFGSACGLLHSLSLSLWKLVRIQLLLTVLLIPLTWFWFRQVPWLGLVANVIAVPWVTLLITPMALVGLVWTGAWELAALLTAPLLQILDWIQAWQWWPSELPAPNAFQLFLVTVGACLWLQASRGNNAVQKRFMALVVLLCAPISGDKGPDEGQFSVLVFDVGQGGATLVRTRSHAMLVDTGSSWGTQGDAGKSLVSPVLHAMDVKLNRVLVTHADADHIGGMIAVLRQHPQASLWGSVDSESARRAGRNVWHACVQGESWVWDGVTFSVLFPSRYWTNGVGQRNQGSCVLRVQAAGQGAPSFLFSGDIAQEQEAILLIDERISDDERLMLDSTVLMAPHHGSGGSSSFPFLQAVAPQWVLVQAGHQNPYGHPKPEVIRRIQAVGARWRVSASCGAMRWESVAPGDVTCQRDAARRYWHASSN